MENLAAIIFAFGVGTALLILPIGEAEEALIGNIAVITLLETCVVIALSSLIFCLVNFIYQNIMLINIHEEMAKASGINVSWYNLLYLLSIAVIVGLAVYLVGGLITVALIAIPAASSRNISKSLFSYKIWSIIFGVVSSILGILIARFYHLPTGPCIIIFSAALFLCTVFVQKRLI